MDAIDFHWDRLEMERPDLADDDRIEEVAAATAVDPETVLLHIEQRQAE